MKLLSLSVFIVLVVASCQPEASDELPRAKVYTSLQDFYSKNKVAPQQVTVNSATTASIQGAKGSQFIFPANAFVTLNNQPVTGEVAIEVKEILKPYDMILSNMPTMSNGIPLESGGQFFVRATKNGEELKLAPGKLLQVRTNGNSQAMQDMQVFNGVSTSDGNVNWQLNTNQSNVVRPDSIMFYSMFTDRVNWLNIDKFIDQPLLRYTVYPGNCPDMVHTLAFIHLTGRNSVLGLPKLQDKFSTENMVAGPATIVALCVKDGKLYYALTAVTLQDGGSTTLQFTETTEEALKEELKKLH